MSNPLQFWRAPAIEPAKHHARHEPSVPSADYRRGIPPARTKTIMKIALFALLGLMLGAIGGAALGIGAVLAWIEVFKTTDFEGYSGMLVFFTFMPLGAIIGGRGGAPLF